MLVGAQASVKLELPKADVSQKTITQDGQQVDLTIVRPAGVKGNTPAFMFFHGGGWMLGDFPTHERLVRDLVADSGAAAVFVNYTPSPEARYPVAINQTYAATKWVADHGQEINVDGSHLAVAGNSVGGNMSGGGADGQGQGRARRSVPGPVVAGHRRQLRYGVVYAVCSKAHFLTKTMMKWFWDDYTTDASQRQEIYASPLQATAHNSRACRRR